MKRNALSIILALMLALTISACGGAQDATPSEPSPAPDSQPVSTDNTASEEEQPEEAPQYEEVQSLFSDIIPNAELKVSIKSGNRLHTRIMTALPSDAAPEGWEDIVVSLGEAIASADGLAADYGVDQASAEIVTEDETILASGFNGKVQFNKFEVKSSEENGGNPPTISKFEYDQISVGMTLSKVREIVGGDGTLQNAVGTAGVTGTVQTYRFLGEKEGSYADILFDDYQVYSKVQIFLE